MTRRSIFREYFKFNERLRVVEIKLTDKRSIKNDCFHNFRFERLQQSFVRNTFCHHHSILSALV